jgi:hypothetical protein
MTRTSPARRVRAMSILEVSILQVLIVGLIVLAALLSAPLAAGAAQGSGNPVLTVTPAVLKAGHGATVTVSGTDYLVPPHAPGISVFGGVYLFFGWVQPGGGVWGPSARNSSNNNGVFGVTYSYSGDGGDASTRDDGSGTMRLVAFTPGGLSGDSTDFHMDDNGNWTATLSIPNSTYRYEDVNGVKRIVNCRQVRCGVFTIGAHGKASSTNERFTPIIFTAPPTVTTTPTTPPPVRGGATPTTSGTTTTTAAGGGVPVGPEPTPPSGPGPTTPTSKRGAGATGASGPKGPTSTSRGSASTTTSRGADAGEPESRASGTSLSIGGSSGSSGGGSAAPWIATGLVALAGIGGGTWLRLRRRSRIAAG